MTATNTWNIDCDLGRSDHCQVYVAAEKTEREARQEAGRKGWKTMQVDGKDRDVCPPCQAWAESQKAT